MIKLYENGVYLLNGTEIVEDTGNVQVPLTKEEAAQNTMAYGILKAHKTIVIIYQAFRKCNPFF